MNQAKAPRRSNDSSFSNSNSSSPVAVPIGPRAIELLDIAYRARRPVLLEGPTGIGKSQIVRELADGAGLEFLVLDLSLLEPPDLVGLPVIREGRTHYASPAELPSQGAGILMLEELNRAEIPVMQPALQLLSARRLHSYELPSGWSCVAAVNPENGDYQVNRLDPALRSRFLQLSVCAERESWLAWARRANVHPVIERVVVEHPDAFDIAAPRSWTYASDVLHVLRPAELKDRELVRTALCGYLPSAWAFVVSDALSRQVELPELDHELLFASDGARKLRELVASLTESKRVDALLTLSAKLRRALVGAEFERAAEARRINLQGLEQLLAPLPGDLRSQCLDTAVRSRSARALLRSLGYEPEAIVRDYANSPVRRALSEARDAMVVHRVQLVLSAVLQTLEETPMDTATLAALEPGLALLARDAGPLAHDLLRLLRAHGLSKEGNTP